MNDSYEGQEVLTQSTPNDAVSNRQRVYCLAIVGSHNDSFVFKLFICYICPAVASLGLILNIVSIFILRRSGLDKQSNILLLGMVIADILCLMYSLDFGFIIAYFGPDKPHPDLCGFQYGTFINYFLAYSDCALAFFGHLGIATNAWFPVIITLERLLAVFKPIHYKMIMTVRRTVSVVVLIFVCGLPIIAFRFSYYAIYRLTLLDGFVIMVIRDVIDAETLDRVQFVGMNVLGSWVPMSLVLGGSVMLAVKIRIALRRRMAMTSSAITWSPRTTKMLMAACLFFAAANTACDLLSLLPGVTAAELFLRYELIFLVVALNSSCNFVIYLLCNRRLIKVIIVHSCFRQKRACQSKKVALCN